MRRHASSPTISGGFFRPAPVRRPSDRAWTTPCSSTNPRSSRALASVASVTVDPLDVRACLQDGREGARQCALPASEEAIRDRPGGGEYVGYPCCGGGRNSSRSRARAVARRRARTSRDRALARPGVRVGGLGGRRAGPAAGAGTRGGGGAGSGGNATVLWRLPESCSPGRASARPRRLFVEAHRVAGLALSMLGDRAAGGTHLGMVIERYEPLDPGAGAVNGSYDAGVVSLSCLASNFWALGQLRLSEQRLSEALALAERIRASPERCLRSCRGGADSRRAPGLGGCA